MFLLIPGERPLLTGSFSLFLAQLVVVVVVVYVVTVEAVVVVVVGVVEVVIVTVKNALFRTVINSYNVMTVTNSLK